MANKIEKSCTPKRIPWNKGLKGYNAGSKNPNFGKFGRNHPCWKEVKRRRFDKQLRSIFKYRQWRSDVFTRDEFVCVLCGDGNYKGRGEHVQLEADHYPSQFGELVIKFNIKSIEEATGCEELWNLNNGRTLCKKCHDPTRGKRPWTKESNT